MPLPPHPALPLFTTPITYISYLHLLSKYYKSAQSSSQPILKPLPHLPDQEVRVFYSLSFLGEYVGRYIGVDYLGEKQSRVDGF